MELWEMVKQCVAQGIKNPFEVSGSAYPHTGETDDIITSEIDYEQYQLLDWQPVSDAYWYALDPVNPTTLINKDIYPENTNFSLFVASGKMFSRADIPVGSVIECDSGYSYLPEGWKALETQTKRSESVALKRVLVDEQWWGDYQYRGFNIWKMSGESLSGKTKETAEHFRIYIPK